MTAIYTGIPYHDGEKVAGKLGYRLSKGTLCQAFNNLWCDALNRRPRPPRFAMIHADIEAEDGWQEKLESLRGDADIISAIVPIRNESKLVSTAMVNKRSRAIHTLSLRECHAGPETFEGDAENWLFVNTGCWLCDFSKPWVEEWCFAEYNRINRDQDGSYSSQVFGEDYGFSWWANRRGLKIKATRVVNLKHRGISNQVVPEGEPIPREGVWNPIEDFWDGNVRPWDQEMFDKNYFVTELQNLVRERQNAMDAVSRADGAICVIQQMMAQLEAKEQSPVNRLAEVNGEVAK